MGNDYILRMMNLGSLNGHIEDISRNRVINVDYKTMNLENIPQESQKIMNQVTEAVEKTGKKFASQVSHMANGKAEEVTEEAIQAAVDKALDVMQIAGERVRAKNINGERVTLEIGVEVLNVARLKITTDVPENKEN